MYLFLGSGKTAAFLIPILSRIFEEGPPAPPDVIIHLREYLELNANTIIRFKPVNSDCKSLYSLLTIFSILSQ